MPGLLSSNLILEFWFSILADIRIIYRIFLLSFLYSVFKVVTTYI